MRVTNSNHLHVLGSNCVKVVVDIIISNYTQVCIKAVFHNEM